MLNKLNFTQTRPLRLFFFVLLLLLAIAALLFLFSSPAGRSLLQETSLTITWTTESELDIIGFNIYRSDSAEGEFVKINDELIPPAVDPFIGGEHTFVDEQVSRGQSYYYQLETIDRHGNTTRSDTIELKAGG